MSFAAGPSTPQTLGGRNTAPVEIRFQQLPGMDLRLPDGPIMQSDGHRITIQTTEPVTTLGALLDWARTQRCDLPGLEVRPPGLEEIYLRLTGVRT